MEHAPGFLEATRAKIEAAKTKIAAVVFAGSIALTGASCTNPGEAEPELSQEPAATATYDTEPGAQALPLVSDAIEKGKTYTSSYGSDILDTSTITLDIGNHTPAGEDAYDWFSNSSSDFTTEQNVELEQLPGGPSAPVLDIKLRPDGTLGFKDYTGTPNTLQTAEEVKLLTAVNENKDLLEPAMQAGMVDGVYFRIYDPDRNMDYAEPEDSMGDMMFISKDYSDGKDGQRSIYYYLSSTTTMDTKAMSLMLGNELAHGALGQTTLEITDSPEERAAFASACTTLREAALKEAGSATDDIIYQLEDLKHYYSPPKFAPAYDAVIRALENGTYNKLPIPEYDVYGGVEACTIVDPWNAVMEQVRKKNINGGVPSKSMQDSEEFQEATDDLIGSWHEMLTSETVYKTLSEATYLSDNPDAKSAGDTYGNYHEFTSGVLNLTVRLPQEFGNNVAALPTHEKQAIFTAVNANRDHLKKAYPENPTFHQFIDKQYDAFFAAANQ